MAKIEYLRILQRTVCPDCAYYSVCGLEEDCAALIRMAKIYEDVDSNDTN